MSTAICLNQIIKDTDMDIAPQMKKMKLNNGNNSADIELNMSNFTSNDSLENLRNAFPSISENVKIDLTNIYTI
jgi:hypothetical protein